MSEEKRPASTSDTLLIQLGTNPTELQTEGVDMSRLGIIMDDNQRPEEYRNYIWWDLRAKLFGSRFAKTLHDSGLNHSVAVGGRGRVDLIKAASVAQGGPVHTEADIIKPNWIVKNIIDRNWEEKERQRLGLQPKTE